MPTRRIRRKGSKSRKGKGKGRRVSRRRQSGGGGKCGRTCPSSPTGQHYFNTRGIMPNTCQHCYCDK
jgi:hypothetical protein